MCKMYEKHILVPLFNQTKYLGQAAQCHILISPCQLEKGNVIYNIYNNGRETAI